MPILRVNRPFKLESLPLVSATQGFWDFSSGSLLDLSTAKNNLIGAPTYSRDSRLLAYNPTGILATDRLSLADTVITASSHFAFWAIIKREAGSTLRLFGRGKDGSGNGWSIDCTYASTGYTSGVVVNSTYYGATVAPAFHNSDWQFVATILQQAEFVEPSHISSLIDFTKTRTGLAGFSTLRTSTIGSAIGIGANEFLSSGGGSFIAMSGIENLAGMTEAAALNRVYTIRDTILPKFNLPQQRNIWIAAAGGVDLAGDAAATATSTAALSVSVPLSGASLSIASASGGLSISIPLMGDATATATATGGLSLSIPLSGDAIAQSLSTGGLTVNITLSGAAIAEAVAAAGLDVQSTGTVSLSGNASAESSATGALSLAIPLSGASLVVSSADGSLSQIVPLAGAAASVSLATGGLDVSAALSTLAGAALSEASAGATLTLRINLDGAALVNAVATGALAGTGELTGTAGYSITGQSRTWRIAS